MCWKIPFLTGNLKLSFDDAFKKPIFFKGKTFLFNKFAVYLKNNNHIVKINNQIHIYRDGIYVPGAREIEAQMIKHIPNLKRAHRSEVLAYLEVMFQTEGETRVTNPNIIAFSMVFTICGMVLSWTLPLKL